MFDRKTSSNPVGKQTKLFMGTVQTFCFEPFLNRTYYYDVSDDGLTYRPYNSDTLTINWEDIDYLQNSSNRWVEVYCKGLEDPVPIYYDTGDFEMLLKFVCDKLAAIHGEIFQRQEFKASTSYFIHILFGLALSLVIIIFGIEYDSKILLAISGLFVILSIHLMNRPLSILLSEKSFLIRSFLFKKIYRYSDINGLNFKLFGSDYSTYLAVNIHLKSGKKLKIQRFDHLILCFILLTLARNEGVGPAS